VKKIPSSNPSSGASSESDEESEPARNTNPMNVQVKSVNSHLTPQSSEEDSKDSNQKKSDSSDDTSEEEEEEETTKIREKTKEKISSMRDLKKPSPTKNSNENNPAVTSSKAAGKRKPPAKFTDEQKSAFVKEVVENLISPMELSKKYGVTPDTIRSWVKKAGYELPKPNSYKKSAAAATAPSKKSESKKISSNVINSTSAPAPDVSDILMKLQPNINNVQLPSPKKSPKKSPVKKPKLEKIVQSPTTKISIPS
jgi:transposase-like protein